MSDDEDFEEQPELTPEQRENHDLRQLRKKAKEADSLRAELDGLRRERAFDQAKLPDDVPGISFFRENYKGDLSPEAIRLAAEQHGFVPPPPAQSSERDTHQRIALAASGNPEAATGTDYVEGMRRAAEAVPESMRAQAIADYVRANGGGVA